MTKISFSFIFTFLAFWTLLTLNLAQGVEKFAALFGLFGLVLAAGWLRFGYWLSSNDLTTIESLVREALTESDAEQLHEPEP